MEALGGVDGGKSKSRPKKSGGKKKGGKKVKGGMFEGGVHEDYHGQGMEGGSGLTLGGVGSELSGGKKKKAKTKKASGSGNAKAKELLKKAMSALK
jgi:hypothetical protein